MAKFDIAERDKALNRREDRGSLTARITSQGDVRYPNVGVLLLLWAFIGIVASIRGFLVHTFSFRSDFVFWIGYVACYLPWGFFSAVIFRLEKRFPLGGQSWSRNSLTLLALSFPLSLVAAPCMRFSVAITMNLLGQPVPYTRGFNHVLSELLIGEFFYWLSVAAGYAIRTRSELRHQREQAIQWNLEKSLLEASLNQAQLDVLRAKLNPHFLFNSLQNISALTREDPLLASRMLAKLGDLLRAVLRTDSQTECSLDEELELLQHYMALEQMRFGDRLDFELNVDREAKKAIVPSFILQPLVENAVVHGLKGVQQHGVVWINARVVGETLTIMVTDNGVGLKPFQRKDKDGGLGLSSTRERLERMYSGRHNLTISQIASSGTEVRIVIPFLTDGGTRKVQEVEDASFDR